MSSPRFPRRTTVTALSLLGFGALAAPLATTPAQAADGGCLTYHPGGYSIGICVNNRNNHDRAYPDYYVNQPALPGNCRIVVELWDRSNRRFGDEFQDGSSCSPGHHPVSGYWCNADWRPVPADTDIKVHAYFRLYVNGRQVNDTTTNSPEITVTSRGENDCHGG
ncbi:hypothetical protein [Amycolatopsis balhimycina]|uniref:hypothetical protein n=1 Tax=Amycolatopsis balhimycina TaxID=208443 RepID=UPI0012FA5434|nr:hypothetical protein [Amycolatopsis balhimycina]